MKKYNTSANLIPVIKNLKTSSDLNESLKNSANKKPRYKSTGNTITQIKIDALALDLHRLSVFGRIKFGRKQ